MVAGLRAMNARGGVLMTMLFHLFLAIVSLGCAFFARRAGMSPGAALAMSAVFGTRPRVREFRGQVSSEAACLPCSRPFDGRRHGRGGRARPGSRQPTRHTGAAAPA